MSDNPFLGDMQTTVIGHVICLTKYEIEGSDNKGGSVWVSKPNTGRNPNIIGDELIKIKIPFELFAQQQDKQKSGEIQLPGKFEIVASIDMGAGQKASLTALSMRPFKPDLPTADSLAAKPNPATQTGTTNKPT